MIKYTLSFFIPVLLLATITVVNAKENNGKSKDEYYVVENSAVIPSFQQMPGYPDVTDSLFVTIDAECRLGDSAVGGGFRLSDYYPEYLSMTDNRPLLNGTNKPTGWRIRAINKDGSDKPVTTYVICSSK